MTFKQRNGNKGLPILKKRTSPQCGHPLLVTKGKYSNEEQIIYHVLYLEETHELGKYDLSHLS